MFDRLIVACADTTQRDAWKLVADCLADEIAPEATVELSPDGEDAARLWRQNKKSRDLLIVDRHLPASARPAAPAPNSLGGGVDLVARLQQEHRPPACILVTDGDNHLANRAMAWPLCRLLSPTRPNEADLIEGFKLWAADLARSRDSKGQAAASAAPPPARANPWALLEVNLHGRHSRSTLRISRGGGPTGEQNEYAFDVAEAELGGIIAHSRNLRRNMARYLTSPRRGAYPSSWKKQYEDLGKRVFKLVNKERFEEFWASAREAANEDARLRFVLDGKAYEGLWESIFDPNKPLPADSWLMLNSTIARRARADDRRVPERLDGGDGTVHMLAIESDVGLNSKIDGPANPGWTDFWNRYWGPISRRHLEAYGTYPTLSDQFGRLPAVKDEMQQLRDLEREHNRKRPATGLSVKILRSSGSKKPLHKRVEAELTQAASGKCPRYDVVHFAGHALFQDGADKPGYLLFGGDDVTQAVPVAEFAGWLEQAGVQLVYLSCCRSSAARAAFELANGGIPLAIGFTWDLDSCLAVDFAGTFYRNLLENDLKVCQALQKTRKELYRRHDANDPIWTSPVLVAQPGDWPIVERCLSISS